MGPSTRFTKAEAVSTDAGFDRSKLKGKSVVLTGGASGLGEQFMRSFVGAGAFVTFGDLSGERGQQLVSELGADKVAFVQCNVLTWADQVTLFKTAMEKSPSKTVDVVLANAGISGQDDVFIQEETPDGEPVEPKLNILKTNLIGVFYTVKLALFYLPKQPQGENRDRCIIMTASLAGYMDQAGSPQYNASKFGLRGLMRSIRQTGSKQGIRINILAPWAVSTRIMSEQVKDKIKGAGIEFAEVEDGGTLVLHFAADHSINGRSFTLVPRSINKLGYFDLERDDWNDGDYMTEWQNLISGSQFRVSTK